MQFCLQSGIYATSQPTSGLDVPMAAVAYNGSASAQTIHFGFQPDWVWIKEDSTATGRMFDNVGGAAPFDMNTPNARLASVAGFSFTERGLSLPADTANISANGQSYRAIGFKQSTTPNDGRFGLQLLSWTGDGTGARTIISSSHIRPQAFLARQSDTNLSAAGGETPSLWSGAGACWELGGSKQTSAFITALDEGPPVFGVTVSSALNVNLGTYIGWVLGTDSENKLAVGTYTGNGTSQTISPTAITGQIGGLFIKRELSTSEGVWFDYTQGLSGLTTAVRPFSALANSTGHNVTLGSASFTLNDADAEYNAAGADYVYFCHVQP